LERPIKPVVCPYEFDVMAKSVIDRQVFLLAFQVGVLPTI